jgi:L-amino acid N-acyltransferase
VRHDRHRRGVGRALLADLVERARSLGHHSIVASVSADQAASVALHRAAGFVEVGRMRELGVKFGTWLDCVYLQKLL